MTGPILGWLALIFASLAVLLMVAAIVRGLSTGYRGDPAKLRENRQGQILRGRLIAMEEGLAWVDEDGTLHNYGQEGPPS